MIYSANSSCVALPPASLQSCRKPEFGQILRSFASNSGAILLKRPKNLTQIDFYPRAPSLDAAHQFTSPSLRSVKPDRLLGRSSIMMVAVSLILLLLGTIESVGADNSVPTPVISRGQGDNCVGDTEFMRRNHMTMLKHQRVETMREGIRGQQYSLKKCIACHAVEGADAKPVGIVSPKHFCRSCHDYAAVTIDCFQCHSSRPEQGIE